MDIVLGQNGFVWIGPAAAAAAAGAAAKPDPGQVVVPGPAADRDSDGPLGAGPPPPVAKAVAEAVGAVGLADRAAVCRARNAVVRTMLSCGPDTRSCAPVPPAAAPQIRHGSKALLALGCC